MYFTLHAGSLLNKLNVIKIKLKKWTISFVVALHIYFSLHLLITFQIKSHPHSQLRLM